MLSHEESEQKQDISPLHGERRRAQATNTNMVLGGEY